MILFRYILVSATALGLDYILYLALIKLGLDAPVAAPISYLTGAALHYVLSRAFVFTDKPTWLKDKPTKELILYAASTALGTVITTLTVYVVHNLAGQSEKMAKIAAIGTSFVIVYLARRLFVFKPAAETPLA